MILGFYLGLISMAIWMLLDMFSRVAVTTWEFNGLVYSTLNLMIGGAGLVLLAGKAWSLKSTLKDPYTWSYSILRVIKTVLVINAMVYLTATASLFAMRVEILMTMAAAAFMLKRHIQLWEWPGLLVVLIGVTLLWKEQAVLVTNIAPPAILIALAAVCGTIMYLIAELHPVNNKSGGWRERAGFTGMMLLATAGCFFVLGLILALLNMFFGFTDNTNSVWAPLVPTLADYTTPWVWGAAAAVGIFLRAPSMYLYLNAARLLKAELIAVVSLIGSFALIGYESIFGWLGWVDASTLTFDTIIASIVMLFGALWLMVVRMNHKAHKTDEDDL